MRVQVKDFMTNSVITVPGTTGVGEIRSLMKRKRIHAIPVVTMQTDVEVSIQGIITATDLSTSINDNIPVKEVMAAARVHVIPPNTSAQSAAKMMLKHKVHHLVVMEDGKIIGMISSLDFVKLVAEYALD